ncbi:RluA family pseudouridine synthase [Hyphomonas sp.]|uniref:RluA family pseudouridine synthase n=1 Tax=Hyphomonas sp. TaxID=87 RepID=UPI003F6FBB85
MTRNRPVPDVSPEDRQFIRSLIVYEDDDLIAFNKPSGLPVQDGRGITRSLDSLLDAFARSNGKRPRLVHRLDAGTSGIVIVAKTQPAAACLSAEFSERRTRKTYLAIVGGNLPSENSGMFDAPLIKVQEAGRVRMIAARGDRKGALASRTGWDLLERCEGYGMMRLFPETGRMHQIRIHLANAGCPIFGDAIYGNGRQDGPRLMLHAVSLEIRKPSGGVLAVKADIPADFTGIAEGLGFGAYSSEA